MQQINPEHRVAQILSYFGRNSLPIYLTHYFFIPSLLFARPLVELPNYTGFSWEFAIGFVGLALTLTPTLLVIHCIQSNRYLNFVLYGEPLRSRA